MREHHEKRIITGENYEKLHRNFKTREITDDGIRWFPDI